MQEPIFGEYGWGLIKHRYQSWSDCVLWTARLVTALPLLSCCLIIFGAFSCLETLLAWSLCLSFMVCVPPTRFLIWLWFCLFVFLFQSIYYPVFCLGSHVCFLKFCWFSLSLCNQFVLVWWLSFSMSAGFYLHVEWFLVCPKRYLLRWLKQMPVWYLFIQQIEMAYWCLTPTMTRQDELLFEAPLGLP